ncbi:MAG: glutaredoxin 3 [Zoogloeaceae bacterium]|jgi:glutaredoxin 3|nr:glutaredoxin 3 [Zoogloeaceae bacterium]
MSIPEVVMYTTARCPYCIRAKELLARRGVTGIEEIRVDEHPEQEAVMIEKTHRRTVPQIFINGAHIGGCDDLAALDRAGKLAPMLAT